MADANDGKVRCPKCGNFVMKAACEGTVELNCRNQRCQAVLEVKFAGGRETVTVLATKK